jgi:hypothetical protein
MRRAAPTLTVDDVVWRLACLASRSYQEHWLTHATLDEYLVPIELIEDVDALRFRISRAENATVLSPSQHHAVTQLLNYIATHSFDSDDILDHISWVHARQLACDALIPFGIAEAMLTRKFVQGLTT